MTRPKIQSNQATQFAENATAATKSILGVFGGETSTGAMSQAFSNVSGQTVEQQAELARQKKIQTMIESDIKQRRKSPGKAQTLLTSSLVPDGQNNNSLLTMAAK